MKPNELLMAKSCSLGSKCSSHLAVALVRQGPDDGHKEQRKIKMQTLKLKWCSHIWAYAVCQSQKIMEQPKGKAKLRLQ